MKKSITKMVAVVACLLSISAFAQLTPEVLYYNFNGSGSTVPNLASAPPAGTATANIMGSVTQGGNTLCQGALIGSGIASSTDYLNTGWAPNLGTGSWTIAWRSQGISTNATLYYIFGDANTSSFRCFTNGVAGSTNWIIRGGGLTDTYINGGALSTSTHCAYVYDAVANVVRGYLNGVLVTTVAQTAPNITGAGPFKVMGYGTNVGAPAGGLIDEFRVYSRALTGAEIAQLNNPFTPSGFTGADVNFCTGASVTLNIGNWPYSTALWSNGSTMDTAMVRSPGTYTVAMSGACGTGNDTITVNDTRTTSSMNAIICGGSYTAPSGTIYTMPGTYVDTIPNAVLCDSLITITLTNGSPTTSSMSVSACGSYTAPSGTVVTISGTFDDTIPNYLGCDSIITITATINQSSSSTMSASACDMYTAPSGAMFMMSGTYMDTITNMAGCDSVITINLTITNSTTATMSASACDMYTAPSGATYTATGTYMDTIANMAGCDSVITINLTITNSTSSTMSASACDMYTGPSGATFTASGTYMDTIPNMAGCDSVITIQLTITNSTTSSINASSCSSYTAPSGAVYSVSGTYMDTISNMAGCDSIITIALQITTVNAGASVAGAVCTATGTTTGATFQWINCSTMTPISGATSINYTATANGSYAVILTIGSCSDTSACVAVTGIGIEENGFASAITLYPNPNSGEFVIDLGASYADVSVVITDMSGRAVFAKNENNANIIPVQLHASAGAYIITIVSGDKTATIRMIKE